MSSSDSDSSDDNVKNLLEAVDTNLFSNCMFDESKAAEDDTKRKNSKAECKKIKSNRYLDDDEPTDYSFVAVSETMQDFVAKKLSKVIENQVKFEDIEFDRKLRKKMLKDDGGLKLLKGCDEDIRLDAPEPVAVASIKPEIKKRKFEADPDDELSEQDKCRLVAVNPDDVINKQDMKHWTDRKKSHVDRYKSKSGPPYQYIEPENEFSALRRKNSWSLKKIARTNFCKTNDR